MKKKFLDYLACPYCHGSLIKKSNKHMSDNFTNHTNSEIQCAQCKNSFLLINGIPRFVDSETYAQSFGKEWTAFSRTQLDSANGTRISYFRFRQLCPIDLCKLKGKLVLDVGCGMGRFLEIVAEHGAEAVGVDMSQAVDSAAKNLERFNSVYVAQADLFSLPFNPETFDYIYSFGVLHHTPSPRNAINELVKYLKPGGKLSIWVYGRRAPLWIPRPDRVYGYFFRLMKYDTLLKFLKIYVKLALLIGRFPKIGRFYRILFPVQDLLLKGQGQDGYEDGTPRNLSSDFVYEWAWLNAFDCFTPKYVSQHTFSEVQEWFEDAGLINIQPMNVRVAVTGTKPGATASY